MAGFSVATGGLTQRQIDEFRPKWGAGVFLLGLAVGLLIASAWFHSASAAAHAGAEIGSVGSSPADARDNVEPLAPPERLSQLDVAVFGTAQEQF